MYTYSPVMDFDEAVHFLAGRIMQWEQESPYLVLVAGLPQIGKTKFCRDINGIINLRKKGYATKPHDLKREIEQHKHSRYFLIENHDAHPMAINMDLHKLFGKGIDFGLYILTYL